MVPELVEYAKKLTENGTQIFILSNNFRERTTYYREHFPDLFSIFDGVYFSWETGFVKPQKEAYEHILEINQLQPTDCVYFDDSEKNVLVAKELGIRGETYKGLDETKEFLERKLPSTNEWKK